MLLQSEFRAYKTLKTRFCPWLSVASPETLFEFLHLRSAAGIPISKPKTAQKEAGSAGHKQAMAEIMNVCMSTKPETVHQEARLITSEEVMAVCSAAAFLDGPEPSMSCKHAEVRPWVWGVGCKV